jgi:serine/threonine protein kinase
MSKLNEYKILKEIGQGCFGKVYLVKKIKDNKLYVAKKIDLSNLDPDDGDKYIKNEKKIMELLNHKNIVHLYDYFEEQNCAFFIIEYCNGGSLSKHLELHKSKYKRPFNQKMIQLFGKQIIEGFNHIHNKGVIHRDIKLENILLNFNDKNFYDYKYAEVKIIDF